MEARPQPQSPWILFFDGATRDSENTNNPAGIGAVLKNGRGHTVVELKKLVGPGVSSGVAKYKSLIAGMKKALSLGVEFLLVKGDSRLIHSQVVGHCSVQDERLVEYQRKVVALAKDFRALFMERISREDNMRADQLANDAIDEELQVVDSLSEFIDQEWTSQENQASQQHTIHSHHHHPAHHHPSHLTRRPHTHPLPGPHLKVKPVASVSPHVVVKRHAHAHAHAQAPGAPTKSSSGRPLFDEDSSPAPPLRSHVQAAAKSSRLLACPEISSSLLSHWEHASREDAPEEESSVESGDSNGHGKTGGGDEFAASGSGRAGEDEENVRVGDDGSESSGDEEGSSDDEASDDEEYSRLVKTLLKGLVNRKKGGRS